MDFVPEKIDDGIVLNAISICNYASKDCRTCSEISVGIHNWLVSTGVGYLIVDFQDEKEVCGNVLAEILQLRKRLRFPFLFAGLMEAPKKFLKSYNYLEHPFFDTPEQAVYYLKKFHGKLMLNDTSSVVFGEAIPCSRSRNFRDMTPDESAEMENEAEI